MRGLKRGIMFFWIGSCHECDLYLLFGFPFMPNELLPKQFANVEWLDVDRNASQLFSSIIRQFVKYSFVFFSGQIWSHNSHLVTQICPGMVPGWLINPVPIGTWNSTIVEAKVWHCLANFVEIIDLNQRHFGRITFQR